MQEITNNKPTLAQGTEESQSIAYSKDGAIPKKGDEHAGEATRGTCHQALENTAFPIIPGKHYFSIGEMSQLCCIKPHVLRYWEHEFPQLKNVKRRGNRRYYTHQQVLLVRQIRNFLYDQGYTIAGAKARLAGEEVQQDKNQSRQLVRQIRTELEGVLSVLKSSRST